MMFIILLLICFIARTYNHFLIPAYGEKQLLELKEILNKYGGIKKYKNQVIFDPIKSYLYLKQYLKNNECNQEIKNFLNFILNNPIFLLKINICHDGSARNIVFLIRPDGIFLTHGDINNKNYIEILKYYFLRAKTIFLNITEETWKEVKEKDQYWNGLYEMDEEEFENDFNDFYDSNEEHFEEGSY